MTRRQLLARSAALLPAIALERASRGQASSSALNVGIAETTITPSWPTPLWGYGNRPPFSTGVLDDIYAKAFLFDNGKRFLIIMLDLGAIGFPLYRRIARSIHQRTKLPEDAVMIQVTHDHSAPANINVTGMDADLRFHELLESKLVALAVEAQHNLAPAVLSYGQTNSSIALNRRVGNRTSTWDKESGPIDTTFSVLQVASPDGKLRGVIVNYPTHPVTLRPDNDEISADFPGVLYKELGSSLNCVVAYMQGCCGDAIPKIFGTTREMNEYGRKMADEARRALASAKPLDSTLVDYRSQRVIVTFVSPYTLDDFREHYQEFAKGGGEKELWAEHLLRYLEDGGDIRQSRDTMVAALRIGELSLAILPGEILHLTAQLIRQQFPNRKLMIAAYSNDTSVGYLPHADEFPKGGYEVNDAWRYYDTLRTTPRMEQHVRESAIALLRELSA